MRIKIKEAKKLIDNRFTILNDETHWYKAYETFLVFHNRNYLPAEEYSVRTFIIVIYQNKKRNIATIHSQGNEVFYSKEEIQSNPLFQEKINFQGSGWNSECQVVEKTIMTAAEMKQPAKHSLN